MRDRILLLVYAAAVVAATSLHDPRLLAAGLAAVLLLAGRGAARLLARSLRAILLFDGIVSASVAAAGLLRGRFPGPYLLLVNLRVLLLTSMTLLLARRVNVVSAAAFSGTLRRILSLALGQTLTLGRTLRDFRLALRSRSPRRPPLRELYRHGTRMGVHLLDRSLANAEEIHQAMISRGLFDA